MDGIAAYQTAKGRERRHAQAEGHSQETCHKRNIHITRTASASSGTDGWRTDTTNHELPAIRAHADGEHRVYPAAEAADSPDTLKGRRWLADMFSLSIH